MFLVFVLYFEFKKRLKFHYFIVVVSKTKTVEMISSVSCEI